MPRYYIGLDIGQLQDYSALAVLEAHGEKRRSYQLRYLEKIPLKTPSIFLVDRVAQLVRESPLVGQSKLIVDASGAGLPIFDLLKLQGFSPVGITITGGKRIVQNNGSFLVPKRNLIRALACVFQSKRIELPQQLPYLEEFQEELFKLGVRFNRKTGHDSYGAKGSLIHDDLVMAAALACWYAELY